MARIFTTQNISDVDIEQIVITRTRDINGNPQVRVRSSVAVVLKDSVDPSRLTSMNLNVNKTIQELGIGTQVNAIRAAILTALQNQIV